MGHAETVGRSSASRDAISAARYSSRSAEIGHYACARLNHDRECAENIAMGLKRAERLWLEISIGRASPDDVLDEIVATIDASPDPDFRLIEEAGAGPLESLFLSGYEEALWARVEPLARESQRFRRALSIVLAVDSPLFERRVRLLQELGEHRTVTLRFVAQPRSFDDSDGFTWREYEVEGIPNRPFLAGLLRSIANRLDQPEIERFAFKPKRGTKPSRPPDSA